MSCGGDTREPCLGPELYSAPPSRPDRQERGRMFRFFLPGTAQMIAVLFTVPVILFAPTRLIPGDPILMMLGDE